LVATAEVHFIWRLASEGGMGNNGVVLLDIDRDQLFKRRDCVDGETNTFPILWARRASKWMLM
jgi:hypothetical protein